jgi:hypothetical protein
VPGVSATIDESAVLNVEDLPFVISWPAWIPSSIVASSITSGVTDVVTVVNDDSVLTTVVDVDLSDAKRHGCDAPGGQLSL